MKIKKIFVTAFGKLEEKEYNFSDGINVIYGKNEAGKSTLSAFIKYMLFGFSGTKTRTVSTNDKLKYMPWSGVATQGSADIQCSDGIYHIERTTGAKTILRVMKNGMETYFGKEVGEEILGVEESAFSKMAFIAQANVKAENMSAMSDSLHNIVFAADETVDVEKAKKKLGDFRNFYRQRTRKTGKCFELEQKIRDLRYAFDENSELHKALLGAEAKLTEIRLKIKSNNEKSNILEKELQNISAYEAKQILQKIDEAKEKMQKALINVQEAKEDLNVGELVCTEELLSKMIEAYRALSQSKENLISAQNNFEKNKVEIEDFKESGSTHENAEKLLKNIKKQSILRNIFGAFTVFSGACCAVGFAISVANTKFLLVGGIFGILTLLFLILTIIKSAKIKKHLLKEGFSGVSELLEYISLLPDKNTQRTQKEAITTILKQELDEKNNNYNLAKENLKTLLSAFSAWGYQNCDENTCADIIVQIKKRMTNYSERLSEYKRCESVYSAHVSANNIDELSETAKNFTSNPTRDKKIILRELDFFKKANENLLDLEKQYIRQAASPASNLRKPSEILAEKQATESQLAEATLRADAAEMALAALEGACDDLKSGISPLISKRASELFEDFTDKKYSGLEISSEFGVSVNLSGMIRDGDFLSTGTRDAAYLALRIALCETLFKEKPVLIFDEVFAHFDDQRLLCAIDVLQKLSESYQILIFTCHKREKALLDEKYPNKVNVINI